MNSNSEQDSPRARFLLLGLSLTVVLIVGLLMGRMPLAAAGISPTPLAQINAALNAAAAVCMVVGFLRIKKNDEPGHKRWMLAAFGISCAFLLTYVLHHLQVGSVPFLGRGWVRTLYFSLLIPHVVLAAGVLPLVLMTVYRGLTGKRKLHRRMARYTLPIWFFVSVSGVAVYFMLYHL